MVGISRFVGRSLSFLTVVAIYLYWTVASVGSVPSVAKSRDSLASGFIPPPPPLPLPITPSTQAFLPPQPILPMQSEILQSSTGESDLAIDKDFIAHLQGLPPIPKIVHIVWPDKNLVNSELEVVKKGVGNLVSQNPDWTVRVHEDQDVATFIENTKLLTSEDKQAILQGHPVEKADVFRLLIIYEVGGLYTDVDKLVNVPLEDVIATGTRMLLPTYFNVNFAQDLMCSAPSNRLFLHAIQRQVELRKTMKRKQGWLSSESIYALGPALWTYIVSKELIGFSGKSLLDAPEADFETIRTVISATEPLIRTYKHEWCNDTLCRPFAGCKSIALEPLYSAYNITPWSDTVDAVWKEQSSRI
jgi:hypothetical protein